MMAKSPEQKFAENLQGIPLSQWEQGKEFLAMSDRALYVFDPATFPSGTAGKSIRGHVLRFAGLDSRINPDLREECVILFADGAHIYRYPTGKTTEAALRETDSAKLPLMTDLALTGLWKDKIRGMTLWTRNNLWYDGTGERIPGLKYAKVTVVDAEATPGDFPIRVKIEGPDGQTAYLNMNYTSDPHESRNFAAIFLLSDPKEKYPHISDEVWKLIQRGKVGEGMTKEECKLSIGNPDEVQSGHNRSQTMDIWQYADGTYLMFTDGLLTKFRQ